MLIPLNSIPVGSGSVHAQDNVVSLAPGQGECTHLVGLNSMEESHSVQSVESDGNIEKHFCKYSSKTRVHATIKSEKSDNGFFGQKPGGCIKRILAVLKPK